MSKPDNYDSLREALEDYEGLRKKSAAIEHPPERIYLNAAACRDCEQILISASRHDFRECKCGNAVDGGREYLRRIGHENLIELSIGSVNLIKVLELMREHADDV